MDSSYLNLVRGNRLSNHMGLEMAPAHAYKYAPDYSYVEIPALTFEKDGEPIEKVLQNQFVSVVPACTLHVRGSYRIQVEPNPAFGQFGIYTPGYNVQPTLMGNEVTPQFQVLARKGFSLTDVTWAVRLYMRG